MKIMERGNKHFLVLEEPFTSESRERAIKNGLIT